VESEGIRATANAAKRLSDLLFPTSLAEHLPPSGELILLPHGALNLIPFAVLPSASGELLGQRYALRYVPSLAMLAEVELRPSSIPPGARNAGLSRNLVIGNPAMPEVQSASGASIRLSGLPGAEIEGIWIGERLGTTTLTGTAANEPEVRLRLPEATIVHLATHAFVYSSADQVASSFIALAPAPGADGLLTMNEILRETPALAAEIVALSACQTGLGDVSQSEGTVGLQRAFLAKGARSVLASLWSVSDDATALLMRRFYTHWLEDPNISKAEALRRAQQEVRMTPGFEDPLYWAAFQLVGAM
jgi:CHAT domain-containing protein